MMSANFTAKASFATPISFARRNIAESRIPAWREAVGFADGLEFLRVDAAQQKDDVDVRSRSQATLCRRTEPHHREKIVVKRPLRRVSKFVQRCAHRLRQLSRNGRHVAAGGALKPRSRRALRRWRG